MKLPKSIRPNLWMGLALCALLPSLASAQERGPVRASLSTVAGRVLHGRGAGDLRGTRSSHDSRLRGAPIRDCATPAPRPTYGYGGTWVPGHYELRDTRVWVEGCTENVWVEPEFGFTLDACGNRIRFLVRAGYWRTVHHPGHFEVRTQRVWIPGRHEIRR